jgi:uncharacterized protein (DUF362 family)
MGLAALPLVASAAEPPPLKLDLHAPKLPPSPLGIPGLFPGRVIEMRDKRAIVDGWIQQDAVRRMVERGLRELTGEKTVEAAWRRFIEPSDIVGIKVNPSGVPGTQTSHQLVREVIRGLLSISVPARNIFVYDRFSAQLQGAGYYALVQPGVRVIGCDNRYVLGGAGLVESRGGYDPNVYCEMSCFGERETRSFMAEVVSREATKIINLPTLKEHNASGVTGCLKNLAYGSFNNVARTHVPPKSYTDPVIPNLVSMEPLRSKAVLHLMDGLRAVWHSGPFAYNPEFVWEAKTLLIGTDPVAVDHIELETVEAKRREKGAPSLWDRDLKYIGNQQQMRQDPSKNAFVREPRHIQTAGEMGLGVWDLDRIDRRTLETG